MKRRLRIMITFMLALILTGCSRFNIEVHKPNNTSMLNGQWKVKSCISVTEGEVANNDLLDSIVSFSNEEVFMFDRLYKKITYKAKVVEGKEYIYNTLGFVPDYLKDSQEIVVVTISSKNTYLKEVIFGDKGILIMQDDVLLYLEKIDDNPMSNIKQEAMEEGVADEKISSGVLIGLKNKSDEGFSYKTLWIAFDGKEIRSQEVPFILLPRTNGFFKVLVNRSQNESYYKDNVDFVFLSGNASEKQAAIKGDKEPNINVSKEITFIGNDYISIRSKEEVKGHNLETLGTYLIDAMNIEHKGAVSLGNISENRNITKFNNDDQGLHIEDINTFTNVAIERNQGRWEFYTTNSNKDKSGGENKLDIPLKVSRNVARYDRLFISWQGIKNEVPSAIDAISSPNKNMAIIKTKSSLYVYKVIDGKMNESPEITISLEGDEEIIMAEWAMAEYVGYWTEQVNSLLQVSSK